MNHIFLHLTLSSPRKNAQDPVRKRRTLARAVALTVWITGGFACFVYACYLAVELGREGSGGTLIPPIGAFVLVLFASVLAWCGRNDLRAGGRLWYVLRILCCAGLITYTVTFAAFAAIAAACASRPLPDTDGRDTVILIFGCHVYGETPGEELTLRLDRAAAVGAAFPDAYYVVSGGMGTGESVTEAEAMRRYLRDTCGIDDARILTEDRATNTRENLRFSAELLRAHGLADAGMIGVSSWYHLARIEFLSNRTGIPLAPAACGIPGGTAVFADLTREYMAWVKLFLTLRFS